MAMAKQNTKVDHKYTDKLGKKYKLNQQGKIFLFLKWYLLFLLLNMPLIASTLHQNCSPE